jgi:hypothetical protein
MAMSRVLAPPSATFGLPTSGNHALALLASLNLAQISTTNNKTSTKLRREAPAKTVRKSIISGPNPNVLMRGIRFASWSPILRTPDSCGHVEAGLVRAAVLGKGAAVGFCRD